MKNLWFKFLMIFMLSFTGMQKAAEQSVQMNEKTRLIIRDVNEQAISQKQVVDQLEYLRGQSKKIKREEALVVAHARLIVLSSSLKNNTYQEDSIYKTEGGRVVQVGYRYDFDAIIDQHLLPYLSKSATQDQNIYNICDTIKTERYNNLSPQECPPLFSCCPIWCFAKSYYDNRPKSLVEDQASRLRRAVNQALSEES